MPFRDGQATGGRWRRKVLAVNCPSRPDVVRNSPSICSRAPAAKADTQRARGVRPSVRRVCESAQSPQPATQMTCCGRVHGCLRHNMPGPRRAERGLPPPPREGLFGDSNQRKERPMFRKIFTAATVTAMTFGVGWLGHASQAEARLFGKRCQANTSACCVIYTDVCCPQTPCCCTTPCCTACCCDQAPCATPCDCACGCSTAKCNTCCKAPQRVCCKQNCCNRRCCK